VPFSEHASALNESQQDHDDGEDQEQMNKSTNGVTAHQTKEPENDQD